MSRIEKKKYSGMQMISSNLNNSENEAGEFDEKLITSLETDFRAKKTAQTHSNIEEAASLLKSCQSALSQSIKFVRASWKTLPLVIFGFDFEF